MLSALLPVQACLVCRQWTAAVHSPLGFQIAKEIHSVRIAAVHSPLGFQIAKEMDSAAGQVPQLRAFATLNALLRAHAEFSNLLPSSSKKIMPSCK